MKYFSTVIIIGLALNNCLGQVSNYTFYNEDNKEQIDFYSIQIWKDSIPVNLISDKNGEIEINKNTIVASDSIFFFQFSLKKELRKNVFKNKRIFIDNSNELNTIILTAEKDIEYGIDRSDFVPSELTPRNRYGVLFPVNTFQDKVLVGIKLKLKRGFIPFTPFTRAKREKKGLDVLIYGVKNDSLNILLNQEYKFTKRIPSWLIIPFEPIDFIDYDSIYVLIKPKSKVIYIKSTRTKKTDSIYNVFITGRKPKLWKYEFKENTSTDRIKLILR